MISGWNEEALEGLMDALRDSYDLMYEIESGYRGSMTNCSTSEELKDYVRNLGERLIAEADYIDNDAMKPDYDDEEEEMYE